MKNYQITEFCHHFLEQHVHPGDFCIDATAGKGNDTEFLCQLTGSRGRVLAFDIQQAAVDATNERLFDFLTSGQPFWRAMPICISMPKQVR